LTNIIKWYNIYIGVRSSSKQKKWVKHPQ